MITVFTYVLVISLKTVIEKVGLNKKNNGSLHFLKDIIVNTL